MKCPKCHSNNPDTARFCGNCAAPLPSSKEIDLSTMTLKTPSKELARGALFAKRYEVIEELGEGGMGRVYRVLDKKINEEVALKLVRSEIAADKRTIDRFSNELKMARKISHKNICRMYHLSEESGTHYISMEYVAGEDLKSMIKMTKQLSVGSAISIAKKVCEGLAEAHRLGIVHRDLKPGNIMIDREGNARIMDFGIARSFEEKGITGAGAMIGTPEYMSPEQVEGKKADQRSDIYSLGVILYEMVAGRAPFKGDSPLSIAMKHKSEIPLDPRKFNAQIPEDLSRAILKCMDKDKEKRYQSAEGLSSDLDRIEKGIVTTEGVSPERRPSTLKERKRIYWKPWMIIAALFVLAVAVRLGFHFIGKEGPTPLPLSELKMLVVLPFDNLGPPEDEYFSDGITEEITSRLSALHGLGVISRTSSLKYRKTDKTIKQIGDELGVDYVLEGGVRWDRSEGRRGRVRVTPQLIRVPEDTHLWSERYDLVIEDIFSVQSQIAEQVAKQLDLTVLEPERKALYARPTNNLVAYDYYLKGRRYEDRGWSFSNAQEFERALEMFEKAIELDPDFTLAYVRMSLVHSRFFFFGIDQSEERLAKSRSAVNKALELQPDLPDARLALAYYYYWGLLDYGRAIETFESAQRARPSLSPEFLGYVQRRQGKWEQSLATLEKAYKLNPRFSQLAYEIGLSYFCLRRYEQAEQWYNRALTINPRHLAPQLGKIGISVLSDGDTEKARALLETLPQHHLTDYMWFTLNMIERNYQGVLDRLDSLTYDSFEEQNFYFQKNLAYASVYHAMKDFSSMKAHAEKARVEIEKEVKEHPRDPRFHAALGLVYAYLDLKNEATQEGTHAIEFYPLSKDAAFGPTYILNLARIYAVVGEYEKAIESLEYLLSIPCAEFLWQIVSVPSLQLDPQWDTLRDHPRFQGLLGQK